MSRSKTLNAAILARATTVGAKYGYAYVVQRGQHPIFRKPNQSVSPYYVPSIIYFPHRGYAALGVIGFIVDEAEAAWRLSNGGKVDRRLAYGLYTSNFLDLMAPPEITELGDTDIYLTWFEKIFALLESGPQSLTNLKQAFQLGRVFDRPFEHFAGDRNRMPFYEELVAT